MRTDPELYPSVIYAYIEQDGVCLYATSNSVVKNPLDAAITKLIFGVYSYAGGEALRWLRRPICVRGKVSDWDRALVKVCAKRLREDSESLFLDPKKSWIDVSELKIPSSFTSRFEDQRGGFISATQAQSMLTELLTEEETKQASLPMYARARAVSAILIDEQGRLVGAAVNSNAIHKICHAEFNLLQDLEHRGLLGEIKGGTLYVSLKPCLMCATLIRSIWPRENLAVHWVEDERGPLGQHQLL